MKKSMVALLLSGIISGAASAQSVSSANVVGYIQVTSPSSNRFSLISAPFNSGNENSGLTLIDVFGTNQLRQSSLAVRCDKIITWDVGEQRYVQYAQKPDGLFYSTANFTGAPTNPVVKRGQALWILAPSATYAPVEKSLYISGDVPNDEFYDISIVGNSGAPFSFIANPYPVEMSIHSLINTNHGANANALAVRADKVRLWDDASQQYVYLALKASTTVPAVNNKWLYASSFTATEAPEIMVKPGQGFWYQTTNAFNWVMERPYSLD